MDLITTDEVQGWMGRTLDTDRATMSIRIAQGWLSSATRLDVWPDPVPDDLWGWAVELTALAYVHNPRQMTQRQAGGIITAWEPDAASRREAILAAARARYRAVGLPRGNFPDPQPWPDGALPWGGYGGVSYL